MGRDPGTEELGRLLAERGDQLMRAAVALTGRREDAEDLLQEALERVLRNRHGIRDDAEGYLRRTLYNLAAEGWRRRGAWRRKIRLLRADGDTGAARGGADATAAVDVRDTLVRLLRQLPPQQRAAIVLRYFEQLTEAEAAVVLGCSEGTVKSATSRGLRRLRELAGCGPEERIAPHGGGRVPPPGGTTARAQAAEGELPARITLAEGRS